MFTQLVDLLLHADVYLQQLVATYGAWMLRNQLLRRPPATARAFTNEFLPGQGL